MRLKKCILLSKTLYRLSFTYQNTHFDKRKRITILLENKIRIGNNSYLTKEGFLKCSGVLCKDGVVDYDGINMLISPKSLEDSCQDWNGQPITFLHEFQTPQEHNPIGSIYNASIQKNEEDTLLVADLKFYDQEAIESILNGETLDLSIGFYDDIKRELGNYKGQPYEFVYTQIIPNHLALCFNGTARVEEAGVVLSKDNCPLSKNKLGERNMPKNILKKFLDRKQKISAFSEDEVFETEETQEPVELNEESVESLEKRLEQLEGMVVQIVQRIEEIAPTSQQDESEEEKVEEEPSFSKMSQQDIEKLIENKALELSELQSNAAEMGVAFSFSDGAIDIKSKIIKSVLGVKNVKPQDIDPHYRAAITCFKKSQNSTTTFASQTEGDLTKAKQNRLKAKDFN